MTGSVNYRCDDLCSYALTHCNLLLLYPLQPIIRNRIGYIKIGGMGAVYQRYWSKRANGWSFSAAPATQPPARAARLARPSPTIPTDRATRGLWGGVALGGSWGSGWGSDPAGAPQ
jgi:hypothetical protein